MKKQTSQIGIWLILTLLILGLSYKGSYGEVPVDLKSLSQLLEGFISSKKFTSGFSTSSQINSLFVRQDESGSAAMIILVAYDEAVTVTVRDLMQTKKIPLLVSVSTLPDNEVILDPTLMQFQQDKNSWHPELKYKNEIFALFNRTKLGGIITDGEIQLGFIMLPEWFDITRPITIQYLKNKRLFNFK